VLWTVIAAPITAIRGTLSVSRLAMIRILLISSPPTAPMETTAFLMVIALVVPAMVTFAPPTVMVLVLASILLDAGAPVTQTV
jgi:hypothetical protein